MKNNESNHEVYALKEPIKATCPQCGKHDVLVCKNCGFCAKCNNHQHCTDQDEEGEAFIIQA